MDMFCEEVGVFCGVYVNLAIISVIDRRLKIFESKKNKTSVDQEVQMQWESTIVE